MKKVLIIIALISSTITMKAQDNLVSGRLGFTTLFYFSGPGGSSVAFGPGFAYQRAIGDNLTGGINFDFHFGTFTIINIEPRLDYYPNSAFDGFHIGTKVGLNSYSFGLGAGLNLGLNLGYTINITDNLKLDISGAPGMTFGFQTGSGIALSIIPMAQFGYAF